MPDKKRVVLTEYFKTLEDFADAITERPINKPFQNSGRDVFASQRDESDRARPWSGTTTYKQAIDVLKKGYAEPLEQIKRGVLKIGQSQERQRPKMKNDFVGFVPHVPNTLMNLPITMINKEKTTPKKKTIHLHYNFAISNIVEADEMIKAGINFLSLVNSLEKQGYTVKIDVLFVAIEKKTVAALSFNLKQYGQRTNLLKLAFPLVHPAMLRRLTFKWFETQPELKDGSFAYGYGIPTPAYFRPLKNITPEKIEKANAEELAFLKNNKILKNDNSYYCNIYMARDAKSVEELAKTMKIIK